jgi:FMN phosphatase YigB (HAD superfamily)
MTQSKKTKNTSKKNKNGGYKVVFLDWNGTLSGSKFWGHLEKTDPKLFTNIENTLFGQLRNLIKPWMKGEIESEYVVRMIADRGNLSYSKIFDEFIHSCMNMEYVSKDVPLLVKKLQKKGAKVVVATDNMDSFNRWTRRYMNQCDIFDDYLNSHYQRGMKKDTDREGNSIFFSDYIKKNKIKPGESILIDDSSDDIDTVKGFGIEYMHIKPVKGFIPALNRVLATY